MEYLSLNPLLYLGGAFENPEQLLCLLRCTGTVLSGSRAADYFVGGLADDTPNENGIAASDWDFFCAHGAGVFAVFTHALSQMGVVWSPRPQLAPPPDGAGEDGPRRVYPSSTVTGILQNVRGSFKIQAIPGPSNGSLAATFPFHSTICQCVITGFAAIDPYTHLTRHRQSVAWSGNKQPAINPPVKKYVQRRIEYVPYEVFHPGPNQMGRVRSMGGYDTCILSFEPYLDTRECNTSFATYMSALQRICWLETPHRPVYLRSAIKSADENDGPEKKFSFCDNEFATQLRRVLPADMPEDKEDILQVLPWMSQEKCSSAWWQLVGFEGADQMRGKLVGLPC